MSTKLITLTDTGHLSERQGVVRKHGRRAMSVPYPNFYVMTKPVGAVCNLNCAYCYYLEKKDLYPESKGLRGFKMSDAVLAEYIQQFIESQASRQVTFAWQGGEPTLLGVEFFRRVVELQEQFRGSKKISNTLQTNGTLLDDAWGAFLQEHKFLVGISVDGPGYLHDKYRPDKGGLRTHARVMRGLEALKRHGVEFNLLCTVNSNNVRKPLEVYRYLKSLGSYIQFIPIVERANLNSSTVTPETVSAEAYGQFLCNIFDEWVQRDVGKVFVQLFDHALDALAGREASLCVFAETCGGALALEHNGDLYSCDHFVYPEYKLGNLKELPLVQMVNSAAQFKFGQDKRDTLTVYCQNCEVRFACHGDCPKHRFIKTPDGEERLSYLCVGYKRFFNHVGSVLKFIARDDGSERPTSKTMDSKPLQ